jgi:NAD(P)-dependent dehydrogenase (short-subunit alcohol dehydrogenase family)
MAPGPDPMGRIRTRADVGNVAALLCSEDADWITCPVICADGGESLMNPEVVSEIQLG